LLFYDLEILFPPMMIGFLLSHGRIIVFVMGHVIDRVIIVLALEFSLLLLLFSYYVRDRRPGHTN